MGRSRKSLLCLAVAVVFLGVVSLSGVQAASAGSPPPTANGTVACTVGAGGLRFSPPLINNGGSAETVKIKLVLQGCSAGGGSNVTTSNFNGKGTGTFVSGPGNVCFVGPTGPSPVAGNGSITIKWTARVGKAKVALSTLTLTSVAGGNLLATSLTFSHQSMSGSFAGTASGQLGSSNIEGETYHECLGKPGLKKLQIVSGSYSQP